MLIRVIMRNLKLQKRQNEKRGMIIFLNKTNEVFNNEFKGFEFNVGDEKNFTYKPGDTAEG